MMYGQKNLKLLQNTMPDLKEEAFAVTR